MRDCPHCLADVSDGGDVCPCCGAALGSLVPEVAVVVPSEGKVDDDLLHFRRQFEERSVHVPEETLRRAKETLSAAGSELRDATVLMVDLCGFSRRTIELKAEGVSLLAQRFYTICADCVLRRGGFVVKFIGDAVLAVFGAPVAFDRDTESAVLAALDIIEGCALEPGEPMAVSIGLATDSVQSGLIDSPTGKVFDIIGEAVNLAARLQSAAGENEIFISRPAHEAVESWFDCEPTPPLALKNIAEGYVAWRVLSRREAAAPRRLFQSVFCGRAAELEKLQAAFGAEGERGARTIHVVGDAGIGKSRLVHEALERTGLASEAVWWEASPSYSAVLLWPVLSWLRARMRLGEEEDPASLRKAIRNYLWSALESADEEALILEYVFGVPEAIEKMRGVPPESIQRDLFALLRSLLLTSGEAPGGALVLVMDDFQWADRLTARFLEALIDWPRPTDLTVVLISRREADLAPPVAPLHLSVNLSSLSPKERKELLIALAPAEEFHPEIRDFILSRAAGNPFFIEQISEIVRPMAEDLQSLDRPAMVKRLTKSIPTSLRALIQSRIDLLESGIRQVLQCASLLGEEFSRSLIDMFEVIREGLEGHLEALRGMRYLQRAALVNDARYYFIHGLYRDIAYSTLLEGQKRSLHLALARRIEESLGERLHERCELLAFHYAQGGDADKTIYYLVKAADRQVALNETATALASYGKAVEAILAETLSPARQALLIRIQTRRGRLLRTSGQGAEADRALEDARRRAEALGNARLLLEARLQEAITQVWRGESPGPIESLRSLAAEAARQGNGVAETTALNALGVLRRRQSGFQEALEIFEDLIAKSSLLRNRLIEAEAQNNAGLIEWRLGKPALALKRFQEALRLGRSANNRAVLCATLVNVGMIQAHMGKAFDAKRSLSNARDLADKIGFAQGLAAIESNLSDLQRKTGAFLSAIERGLSAIDYSKKADDPHLESSAEENAGLAFAAKGEFKLAEKHLQRARDLAEKIGSEELQITTEFHLLELNQERARAALGDNEQIDKLLEAVENAPYPDIQPLAYRVKARALDNLEPPDSATARQFLEKALETAQNTGAFFEQLACRVALLDIAKRVGPKEAETACLAEVERMKKALAVPRKGPEE